MLHESHPSHAYSQGGRIFGWMLWLFKSSATLDTLINISNPPDSKIPVLWMIRMLIVPSTHTHTRREILTTRRSCLTWLDLTRSMRQAFFAHSWIVHRSDQCCFSLAFLSFCFFAFLPFGLWPPRFQKHSREQAHTHTHIMKVHHPMAFVSIILFGCWARYPKNVLVESKRFIDDRPRPAPHDHVVNLDHVSKASETSETSETLTASTLKSVVSCSNQRNSSRNIRATISIKPPSPNGRPKIQRRWTQRVRVIWCLWFYGFKRFFFLSII